jgi:ABC-type Fe3+-hydroxamate transport system substrate-binding protein
LISLVPSTTETVAALGAGERLVGRTRWCVRPRPWVDSIPEVGGTKDPDLPAIAALSPDLILVNREENREAQFPALSAIAPLWIGFPRDVEGALQDVAGLAEAVGAQPAGEQLLGRLREGRAALRASAAGRAPWRYVLFVWRRPWRAAGPDTYASALLSELGGVNAAPAGRGRYPACEPGTLAALAPDLVLLPSEPYAFEAAHVRELGELAPRARLVDGEHLFWHGARMAEAFTGLPRQIFG